MRIRKARGFSLLEILFALMILSMGLTGVLTFFGTSQNRSRQAEALTIGTMLARQKMAEVVLDLQSRAAKGEFPGTDESEDGAFEGRFERYRWAITIRKIELPLPPMPEGAEGNPLQIFMKFLKLDEAVREVKLNVLWTVRDRERSISVTTHLVKL